MLFKCASFSSGGDSSLIRARKPRNSVSETVQVSFIYSVDPELGSTLSLKHHPYGSLEYVVCRVFVALLEGLDVLEVQPQNGFEHIAMYQSIQGLGL